MSIGFLSQIGFEQIMQQFAAADPNLNQFGFGELWRENGEIKANQVYPGMWVNPQSTNFLSDFAISRNYQILIYDLVFNDSTGKSNQNSIISDCEEIAFRLVRFLKSKSDIFDIQGLPTIAPFSDRWLDQVSGVTLDVNIVFNFQSSDCDDPDYSFQIKSNQI